MRITVTGIPSLSSNSQKAFPLRRVVTCALEREKLQRCRIAVNEIENAVRDRVHAGDKGRPRHWTLRGRGCSQALEIALSAEPVQIGQRPPVPLDEIGIHTIDAEDDDFLCMSLRMRRAAGNARS